MKVEVDKISEPEQAQSYIENYWINQMKEFLNTEVNLVQRPGSNVNHFISQELNKSLNGVDENNLYNNISKTLSIVEANNSLKMNRFHDKLFNKFTRNKYNNLVMLIDYKEAFMIAYLIGVDSVIKRLSHSSIIKKLVILF
uniref:hypothetical protein n=1 Tax=Daedalea confragosa TaxID=2028083 RepID=UPI002A819327|nr:hypothetical protein UYH48_mgp07 [Daedaleopsis confragosa]WNZ34415.1 hypothetical protein [Daedaleopsis confragosa]